MYESKDQALIHKHRFISRLFWHVIFALLVILIVMLLGVVGNLWFETISLHDAVLNIALMVSGIGPFAIPQTPAGKVFFSIYGVCVSLTFAATIGFILAPVAHRILHKFHLDHDDDDDSD